MALHLNNRGERYNDEEPCFCSTANGMLYNRITQRWVTGSSMLDRVNEMGWTWKNREVGIPSIRWQLAHTHVSGQNFAPPWDDTSGLASEAVSNGEDWTGASGATPPTGWIETTGGSTTYTVTGGVLQIQADPVLGVNMTQDLTVTAGEVYVLELSVAYETGPGATVCVNGLCFPIGPGPADGDDAILKCASFTAPDSGTVTVGIAGSGGTAIAVKFVRCYLESELTGSGGATAVEPVEPTVVGPWVTQGTTYWLDRVAGTVGFSVDGDASPDLWWTWADVKNSELSRRQKKAIRNKLRDYGFDVSLDE